MDRISAADYHDLAQVSDPNLAPDGERVAFVRSIPDDDERTEATIYVADTAGDRGGEQFTIAAGEDSEPRFSPSGDRLAFVSTRTTDENRPQLWVMPADGGEARQVTAVAGGVSAIEWSPDGDRIAFTQRVSQDDREQDRDLDVPEDYEREDPDPRVIDRTVYRAGQRYFDGGRSHVYLADLGDDTVHRVTAGESDFVSPTWGDGETLYYAERVGADPDDSTEYAVFAHDVPAETAFELFRTSGLDPRLDATADGRIAHVYQDPEQTSLRQEELHVYDRDTGETTTATAHFDRTLAYHTAPMWGPGEEHLYLSSPDEGDVPIWRVHWGGEEPAERVVTGGHVDGFDVVDGAVALTRSEWNYPGDVFLASDDGVPGPTADERVERLSEVNESLLAERAIAEPEEISIDIDGESPATRPDGSAGRDTVQGWVLTPPDFDPEETYPLAVEIHGGPHLMWSSAGTTWHEFQTLAARGYVVFWSNPRGSTGYGEDFAAAIERDWGAVTMADVMAGARQVAQREYVDSEDSFVTGGSFGGYMTSWIVGHTDFFEAAVTQRGVHDLTGFYGSTDAAYKLIEGDFDTTPWEEPELLTEHSPATYCDRVETPTLVVHSDDDYRTPANTAELFYRGLRKHGVDTRLVRYPREGHELSRAGEPAHVVDRIERIVRWFDGYSTHSEAAPALERDRNDGLSTSNGEE
ncbi:MAG: S9 family peptidase [Halorhabdus sp.]